MMRSFPVGVALLLTACGDGPTESDGTRVCEVPIRVISPVPQNPDVPVLWTPVSPVSNANCAAESPVFRFPARDSTTIVVPPRPTPLPNPGGD